MINKFIIYLFACIALPGSTLSQLDIGSFKKEIVDFTIIDTVPNNDSTYTVAFASSDSSIVYEVDFNREGEIVNDSFWRIAISKRMFDDRGRMVEYSAYRKDGSFAILDTPPIIQTVYFDSIAMEQTNYLFEDRTLAGRIESSYDIRGREIETRRFDENALLESFTTYDFDDELHTRTEKDYNSNSELRTNRCGCAIHVITFEEGSFDMYDFSTWTEERFYDHEMNLVDSMHNYVFEQQFSIVQREKLTNGGIKCVFRNSKNEIVLIKEFASEGN